MADKPEKPLAGKQNQDKTEPFQNEGLYTGNSIDDLKAVRAINKAEKRLASNDSSLRQPKEETADDLQIRRHEIINTNLEHTAESLEKYGMPPYLSAELAHAHAGKLKLIYNRWRTGMPDNATDDEVTAKWDKIGEKLSLEKDSAKRAAIDDRMNLGLAENASEREFAEALKKPAANELRRYKATPEQVEEARERSLSEAVRTYFGLDKNASYDKLCQAMAEEQALDFAAKKTAPRDTRLLLNLPDQAPAAELQAALEKAEIARLQRHHMPVSTAAEMQASLNRLPKVQFAKAQAAQKHALGIGLGASDKEVVLAIEENRFTKRRRENGCPADLPDSAMHAWKIVTE